MAKAKITEKGKEYTIDLNGTWSEFEKGLLLKHGIVDKIEEDVEVEIELKEEKPTKKKKYKNVEQKKDASKDSDRGTEEIQNTSKEEAEED